MGLLINNGKFVCNRAKTTNTNITLDWSPEKLSTATQVNFSEDLTLYKLAEIDQIKNNLEDLEFSLEVIYADATVDSQDTIVFNVPAADNIQDMQDMLQDTDDAQTLFGFGMYALIAYKPVYIAEIDMTLPEAGVYCMQVPQMLEGQSCIIQPTAIRKVRKNKLELISSSKSDNESTIFTYTNGIYEYYKLSDELLSLVDIKNSYYKNQATIYLSRYLLNVTAGYLSLDNPHYIVEDENVLCIRHFDDMFIVAKHANVQGTIPVQFTDGSDIKDCSYNIEKAGLYVSDRGTDIMVKASESNEDSGTTKFILAKPHRE